MDRLDILLRYSGRHLFYACVSESERGVAVRISRAFGSLEYDEYLIRQEDGAVNISAMRGSDCTLDELASRLAQRTHFAGGG